MTLPRFLVSPGTLTGTCITLTGSELHHLRVRRLRVGSQVILGDGKGTQMLGTLVALDRNQALIQLETGEQPCRDSPLRLVLALAALKADKMDWVVEKATELGVSEVQVFTSSRSLAQPSGTRSARWQRIARSAAKQCQRSTVPLVRTAVPFDTLMAERTESMRLLFWERHNGGAVRTPFTHPSASEALIVVGPEGGFAAAEAERAAAHGFQLWSLGPRVLRAETAALAAVTLCQFLWGDLG
jgi:16S rRNA (uracil1498-N3)-methyltransferase